MDDLENDELSAYTEFQMTKCDAEPDLDLVSGHSADISGDPALEVNQIAKAMFGLQVFDSNF